LKYWFIVFIALVGASCATLDRPPEGTIAAKTWLGFRINELAQYDRLTAQEKDDLRSQFWLDLSLYEIKCPPPKYVDTVYLRTADGGVSPEEMEAPVRACVKELHSDLDIYAAKSQDYECIGGVRVCKRTFELTVESRPFVISHETRVGEISATVDITLVIELR
jgi:hypothetical protein